MTRRTVMVLTLAAYLCAASAVMVVTASRAAAPLVGIVPACLAGAVLALALYVALARKPPRLAPIPRRRLGPTAVLVVAATCEEIVWRGGVLAATAHILGAPAGLTLSTAAFALRHVRLPDLTGLTSYVVLGLSFGGLFLLTRQLVAAVVSHVVYDLVVVSTRASRRLR